MGRATAIGVLVLALLSPAAARADGERGAEAGDGLTPHPPAAIAPPEEPQSPAEHLYPKAAGGFFLANATFQSVPSAVSRSQADYGLSSVVGVSASGHPWEKWDYLGYVTASVGVTALGGSSGAFSPEQITIAYHPAKVLTVQGGYLRIPFSTGQAAVIANSLFPTRPEPTALFQGGADAGLLATYESPESRLKIRAGFFDGLSLLLAVPGHTTKGPVFAANTEIAPLGALSPLEGDFKGTPLRFALSGSVVYRQGNAYDPAGYRGLGIDDVRLAFSLRVAVRGFYAQGEYLQDRRVDDLSGRPRLARGAYGEISYHSLVGKRVGLAPMTRVGWSVQDEGFFPLHVVTAHAGLALYPRGDLAQRGGVRLVLEYLSERHIEESETAYGGLASILTRF